MDLLRSAPRNATSGFVWGVDRVERRKFPWISLKKLTLLSLATEWLSLYVAETRKQDGGRYPPKSVCMLLTDFFVIICALFSPRFVPTSWNNLQWTGVIRFWGPRVPIFPGKMGTPLGKWGPPHCFRFTLHQVLTAQCRMVCLSNNLCACMSATAIVHA